MHVFSLEREQQWDPKHHVEKILGKIAAGDVTIACWEPGQISPYHCHPHATEIYFCFTGGGTMRTPANSSAVTPGAFVVHPPGEVHDMRTGRRAPCYSACATAPICARIITIGAATAIGSSPPTTPTTIAVTRLADYIFSRLFAFPLRIFTLSESEIGMFFIHSTAGGFITKGQSTANNI